MNYDIIVNSTNAICRYAKNNDSRLPKALKEFYQEGIKSPGVAKHLGGLTYSKFLVEEVKYLRDPMTVSSLGLRDTIKQVMSLFSVIARSQKTVLRDPELLKLKKAFDQEFKRLYPNNGKMKDNVISNQIKKIYNNDLAK